MILLTPQIRTVSEPNKPHLTAAALAARSDSEVSDAESSIGADALIENSLGQGRVAFQDGFPCKNYSLCDMQTSLSACMQCYWLHKVLLTI